ncbi:MAG TPA: PadR family transcriptional regulator [Candidatus Scybalocola faecipullorum]|nr:PadR family transcriptional regulator [Candidatus Scybalocola faecipullorum]
MNAQFKKGALEICVLSQLASGDKYGYELTEVISEEMSIATGTLYPILKKLKDDLYVETYLVEAGEGPARKYYHLTEKGRAYQGQQKQEWQAFVKAVERLIG